MVAEVDGGDVAENAWQARVHRKPVPPELEKGFHHVLVCEENVSLLSPVKVILRGLFIGLQNLFLGERNYESSFFFNVTNYSVQPFVSQFYVVSSTFLTLYIEG